ncbi:glycosyltransferase 25 family member [Onthophagus taurus]|uniref:glycosyltransferase 25 family member n=1 Tax=Onthophagus taurus TaxID=166361 RepID=UPI0039BE96C6
MWGLRKFRIIILFYFSIFSVESIEVKLPTVLISVLARNKAHTLPYFLSLLERLHYPKNRISLRIRSDHNIDKTAEILQKWVNSIDTLYHSVDLKIIDDESYTDESGPSHWSQFRFDHVISLREDALNHARNIWADYLLAIDCDVFLTNPDTLLYLVSKNLQIVAPMLRSDGLYSNFWYGMTEDYYYLRTDEYKPVYNREKQGCFHVPMVHTCVLIDLRNHESDRLTYVQENLKNYNGPHDDIITFAISANKSGIEMHLCNEYQFGFLTTPLEEFDTLIYDYHQLKNIKLEVLSYGEPLFVNELLEEFTSIPEKDTLGFDKIYMINLRRRPERRKRMMHCFDELGLDVSVLDAVDGKALNETALKRISFLPNYSDPYHKRPMTFGEIGCFLSHYQIWKEIVENNYQSVLVLEDDIRFEPFFRPKVINLMQELKELGNWDLVYFGRKRLQDVDEPWIPGSKYLVKVGYSYWTLGYVLSFQGAKKLLDADPLSRLLPVDEYLPILFDKHPTEKWKIHFPKRDLIAFSVAPLLVFPTHYTGEKGYISDTEDSGIIANESKDEL